MAEPGALITMLMEHLEDCDEEFEEDNGGSCVSLYVASVTGVQDKRRDAAPRLMQYMACVVEDYTAADFKKNLRFLSYFTPFGALILEHVREIMV